MKQYGRLAALLLVAAAAVLGLMTFAGGAGALLDPGAAFTGDDEDATTQDGTAELRDVAVGNFLTECPQAGLRAKGDTAQPLDRREVDAVEKISNQSGNIRANQDYTCMPQDETSLDINPTNSSNLVGGANDYRLGTGSSGFYASTDRGKHWYDGIIPFPTAGAAQSRGEGFIVSGGDPAIAFDRAGVAYYAQLAFFRGNDTGGVFVSRSTNGGFTWSRARIGGANTPGPSPSPNTDPRQPGDGVVSFQQDNDDLLNSSVNFNDKEYITTGPRPTGVSPQCFDPNHAPAPSNPDAVGVDRVYVSWTIFNSAANGGGSQIVLSYSDDQGRSWSNKTVINGSAAFCVGRPGNECRDNQGSTPTVNPTTGQLWVGFLNGDTPDEDQYVVVTSTNGGQTFGPPMFVSPIFDINYPRANSTRPDCFNRGAQTRSTLTNSCFRVNSYGNVVADRRGGAFADDLYVVLDDNRNGTPASSNVDVFYLRSTDGGQTWIGPTRVNNDRSVTPPNRDCGRAPGSLATGTGVNAACGGVIDYGNDNWFPWIDVSSSGTLSVGFFDRRLDTNSVRSEWPTSRTRPGNYLTWFFGATCRITSTGTPAATGTAIPAGAQECNANEATLNRQPTAAVDPGATVAGSNQTGLPFKNFQVSDVPFNLDYAFRGGIFIGDYNNVAVPDNDNTAYGFWTDSRNGRSSGGPGGGVTNPSEPGRNPLCEQSDVFLDVLSTDNGNGKDSGNHGGDYNGSLDPFLVTLCPPVAQDKKSVAP
jgi:hypothetical protein